MRNPNTWLNTAIMGAVCGDVVGSVYEWNNIKYKLPEDKLLAENAFFTDDTVMTCAVAHGLTKGLRALNGRSIQEGASLLTEEVRRAVVDYGLRYPDAGYGGSFQCWLHAKDHAPYHSWGNGSAMRASYAGWLGRTLEEAELLAEISASVTHDHPEGVKGAKVVAGCIFLLRQGGNKQDVRAYASRFYDMAFTLDGIRDSYTFDVSCQGTVPQSIQAFLEAESFPDALSAALSIGGDSDTLAAITGSLAEVIYPIPAWLRQGAADRLDAFLRDTLRDASDLVQERSIRSPAERNLSMNSSNAVPLHLAFLQTSLPDLPIELHRQDGQEWACIQHPEYDHTIRICYCPNDPDPYYLAFATQHLHIETADDLIESIRDFADAKYAAIEFYRNGYSRFGGQIETALLDHITYEALRKLFGGSKLFFRWMTFRVTAWDHRYCFEGCFRRGKSGQMEIVRAK